jgi:hypothetical protein
VNLAARVSAISAAHSPYPASFNNNGWLYFSSLTSLMCISMLCAVVFGWMARDIWRDRFEDHPLSLAFLFRFMVAVISSIGFIRCAPEVAFITCYGEVTGDMMSRILTMRRFADTLALPNVVLWQAILALIYPFVMIALKSQQARAVVVLDPLSVWPRLVRAFVIVVTIVVISAAMALGKGAMGHAG